MAKRCLLTGVAGFIGFHTAKRLLEDGWEILGLDSVNDYYDPRFKEARLQQLRAYKNFSFTKMQLEDAQTLTVLWKKFLPSHVIHLAAQAGVRYSLENPKAYIDANIVGFQSVIDLVKLTKPENFVYASSSSVYGSNRELPFTETQSVADPLSLYAASKIANELVAKTYGNLYGIANTGLRFFTVYGPQGRPDMALFSFVKSIAAGLTIQLYNFAEMQRDFTYIDDIVDGILAANNKPEHNQVYNLGRGVSQKLRDMVSLIELQLGKKAQVELVALQPGDVTETLADISKAKANLGYSPRVNLKEGIAEFVKWYAKDIGV